MNDQQQRRLAELIVGWHQVDGRSLSAEELASLRRRIIALRLDAAAAEVMQLSAGTGCEIMPAGCAGPKEGSYSQYNFGLRLMGCDYTADAEQWISFQIEADGKVLVERSIVTRHQGDDFHYVPAIKEAVATADEATVEWFIDRLLDFVAAKVADPRPSGLPLETPTKAPEGRAPHRIGPRVLLFR